MDSSVVIQLLALLLLILLSGFFSSAETAMTTISRIRIQSLKEQGDARAAILEKITADPGKMLSAVLVGNNIVNMSVSALSTTITIRLFGNAYVGIATGLLTLLILIFGEITPKTLATIHAEKMALRYARVIYLLMHLLSPVIFLVNKISLGILLLLKIDPAAKTATFTEYELRTIVNTSQEEGVIESEEKQMIYNVFDFGDSVAKDVMIPRIDMCFVDVNATYQELLTIFEEEKHTRFPVYEDSTDNVIGIINMKDLLLRNREEDFSIRKILRDPYFTYEHKSTAALMVEMRKDSVNLAIVLDEYGSTAGLVTLEDLLEEIVGEIRDEYDADEEEELTEIIPGQEYLALGSVKLDDLNEALGTTLTSEDYDSLGGYIIEQLDKLPILGQSITLENQVRLVVEELDKNRIAKVRLYLPSSGASDLPEDS